MLAYSDLIIFTPSADNQRFLHRVYSDVSVNEGVKKEPLIAVKVVYQVKDSQEKGEYPIDRYSHSTYVRSDAEVANARNERRAARLLRDDMLDLPGVHALLGSMTGDQLARATKNNQNLIVESSTGEKFFPKWQFEDCIKQHLPKLIEIMKLDNGGGWRLLAFFETSFGGLDGRTPRQALEQGDVERVVAQAYAETH
jgi:hypothetical protein